MEKYLNYSQYIVPFVLAVALSAFLTYLVRKLAIRRGIVDNPAQSPERKIHAQSVPLLGGIAIFLTLVLITAGYAFFSDRIIGGYLLPKHLIGIALGGLLIMVGGYLDDRHNLSPARQIAWPILACLVVIGSGIGIEYISNPFGGTIALDSVELKLFTMGGIPYYFTLFADLFAFCWLMGMMYTTKFLDGLDGLVSGVTTIGASVLFFLSLNKDVAQPETALLAAILVGASLGFLVFNFHPAKIFLGEGGSLFTGFMLGVLSIISGAKIATALLIMSIPILDVLWVILRRWFLERKSPFKTADKKHIHFRLLESGLSHRQAVLLLYGVSALFGALGLFLHGVQKIFALSAAFVVMIMLSVVLVRRQRRRTGSAH
ncbi:MAG: MraY family glycosyltransferase [Patescibacteria group bacterium]